MALKSCQNVSGKFFVVFEISILKTLLEFTPEDPQALRLAVQAAAFSKNKDFGEYAISLMKIHNPSAVPLARGFLDNAFD